MESLQTHPPESTGRVWREEGQPQPPELEATEVRPGREAERVGEGLGRREDWRWLGFSSSGSHREGRFPEAVGHGQKGGSSFAK